MQVGVHPVPLACDLSVAAGRFRRLSQEVRPLPVPFGLEPKRLQRCAEFRRRAQVVRQRVFEIFK